MGSIYVGKIPFQVLIWLDDFLQNAGMVISIVEPIPKPDENVTSLSQVVKVNSATVKAEEISEITNANILDHETAEFLENKLRKTLEEMRSLDWHHIYGNYNHMKWFRAYRQLRDAGTNNEMAVGTIIHIDDRERYKSDDVKTRLNSLESISYLQGLVPKMARVFDNTDASHSAKKLGLKTVQAKLGLLNSALYTTYGLKLKATNKKNSYYHLDDSKVNNAQITEEIVPEGLIQDLFDIC
ncbi:hypothetical protein C1645_834806 [Glomus cerebriforme]|uniref:Uncharacterized protein n=1 Tax=Glomus cerebriforme TaxID=658196 RepID=A0A397SFM3_9GLOM|nr:hypothetical protein C1645_834806 [Glomus cerebriforme]